MLAFGFWESLHKLEKKEDPVYRIGIGSMISQDTESDSLVCNNLGIPPLFSQRAALLVTPNLEKRKTEEHREEDGSDSACGQYVGQRRLFDAVLKLHLRNPSR